jgi:hypothetical protein
MKTSPVASNRIPGVLVALISALACHGLVFSYLQLQRPRVAASTDLQSPDNTPELLQLSRESAPLTQLDHLPLPKARTLPPPPALLPVKSRGAKPKSLASKASQAVNLPGRKLKPVASAPFPVQATKPDGFKDVDVAVDALRLFQRQSTLALAPAQQDVYNTLWAEARPYPRTTAPTSNPLAPSPLEIRWIPLQQAQSKELPIRHHQFVVMTMRVALFWLDGSRVWILQSVLTADPSEDPNTPSVNRSDG